MGVVECLLIHPTKPFVFGKDLVETKVNVCQVQTGHHRHFVYDEEFELGKRHAHHLECLFRELPVASSSALVLNGQLQQSMDRDTTDIECCQSCGSGDGTQWWTVFPLPTSLLLVLGQS